MKVLCVATDPGALAALRRATVAAEWELAPGATTEADALDLLERERPHAMVAFGDQEHLVALARERFPAMRIVTDRDVPGASAVVPPSGDVREILRTLAPPGGPVLEGGGR